MASTVAILSMYGPSSWPLRAVNTCGRGLCSSGWLRFQPQVYGIDCSSGSRVSQDTDNAALGAALDLYQANAEGLGQHRDLHVQAPGREGVVVGSARGDPA